MKLILVILIISCYSFIYPQGLPDTTYQIEITISASPLVSFFRYERYPGAENRPALGSGIFLRGMWHPGRMLAVGFLTGFAQISKDEFSLKSNLSNEQQTIVSAQLTAIPLQIAVTMQTGNFEFGLGMGPYLMQSTIYYGKPAHGHRFELGITFLSSYRYQIIKYLFAGPELRLLYMSYRGIISIMPSVSLRLESFKY